MTEELKTKLFAYASIFIYIVTFAIFITSPRQTSYPVTTHSTGQIPDITTYVFTDPAVVARRAQSARDTEQSLKKSCAKYPKGYDCLHLKPKLIPKINAEWGIAPGGQVISG